VTHHEILEDPARPATIAPSDCPGEVLLWTKLFGAKATELWRCNACDWTIYIRIDEALPGGKVLHAACAPGDYPPPPTIEEAVL
jgi:hypothetical protein